MVGIKIKDLDAVVDISGALEIANTDGSVTTKITLQQVLNFVKDHLLSGWSPEVDDLDELRELIENGLLNKKVFRFRSELVTAAGTEGYFTAGDIASADGVHYFFDNASTTIPGLTGFIPLGEPTSKHFGAVGDGAADDTAAIQALLNYNSPTAYVPSGTYNLTSKLNLNADKTFRGDGISTKFNTDGITTGFHVFDVQGSAANLIETNFVNISSKQRNYTFSSENHGLVSGDIVAIRHNTDGSYNPARSYYNKGEFMRVKSVNGSSVTFTSGFYDNYPEVSSSIYKMNMIQVEISNLVFEGSVNNHAEHVLTLKSIRDSKIENVTIFDAGNYTGLSIEHGYNVSVNSVQSMISEFGDLSNNAYPIVIGGSQDVRVTNSHASSPWHALAVGSSSTPNIVNRSINVSNSHLESYNGLFPADFHGNVEHSGFYNCTMKGGGATMGGNHNQFIGNRIVTIISNDGEPNTSDLCFYNSEAIGLGFNISNNTVEIEGWYPFPSFGQFVEISQTAPSAGVSGLIISNNEVILSGEIGVNQPNMIINVRGVGTDGGGDGVGDVSECMVNITGNTIYSKLSPVVVHNVINIWSGSVNPQDNFKSVNISNNTLNGVGISVNGGGNVNINGNIVTNAYRGILALRSQCLNISSNVVRGCLEQACNVTNVANSCVIQGNSFIENQSLTSLSGPSDCELFFSDEGFSENNGGQIITNNIIKCLPTTSHLISVNGTNGILENNNVLIGEPLITEFNTANVMDKISHRSSTHERDFVLEGDDPQDVCIITFDNGSWGSVQFECDLIASNSIDYNGNFKSRIRGHSAVSNVVIDNTSFTSVTDPTTGVTPALIFTPVGNIVTISIQGGSVTEVLRINMKAFKAARSGDMSDLKINWKV